MIMDTVWRLSPGVHVDGVWPIKLPKHDQQISQQIIVL